MSPLAGNFGSRQISVAMVPATRCCAFRARVSLPHGSEGDLQPNLANISLGQAAGHRLGGRIGPGMDYGPLASPSANTNLHVYLTGSHGNARLLTGGNDFLQALLAVAENSDKSNKHGGLR